MKRCRRLWLALSLKVVLLTAVSSVWPPLRPGTALNHFYVSVPSLLCFTVQETEAQRVELQAQDDEAWNWQRWNSNRDSLA